MAKKRTTVDPTEKADPPTQLDLLKQAVLLGRQNQKAEIYLRHPPGCWFIIKEVRIVHRNSLSWIVIELRDA
jgi:hypothetical protein